MRRMVLGAVWLIGLLMVVSSWGMLLRRAEGEGPARMIGKVVTSADYSSCQLTVINPESGAYKAVGNPLPSCYIDALGWSADQAWFYYKYMVRYDSEGSQIYNIERIDRDFRQPQLIVGDVSDSSVESRVFGIADLQYLVYSRRIFDQTDDVPRWFISDGVGQNTRNLPAAIVLGKNAAMSPNQQAAVIAVKGNFRKLFLYWVDLASDDGNRTVEIPNFWQGNGRVVLWSNAPEWLVWYEEVQIATGWTDTYLYKVRLDGSNHELIASAENAEIFTGWVHQSGIIGLQEGNTFKAIWVDTGEILWQLEGVEKVYNGTDWDSMSAPLDKEWVHFKMLDGRLARCRFDGSELTFYDTRGLPVWQLWGWSPDGNWVWFETDASHPSPDVTDVMRVQAQTGKTELILDDVYVGLWGWSPDGKWVYYYDSMRSPSFGRVRADGTGKPEIIDIGGPLVWTPPYEAKWQPARPLIIGNGLMSVSILVAIVLWRRKKRWGGGAKKLT